MESVITDTEFCGRVTRNLRPVAIVLLDGDTASGREKSLAALSEDALIVFICARAEGVTPCRLIVVTNALVGFVFTALMKIVLPSAERLAVTSR